MQISPASGYPKLAMTQLIIKEDFLTNILMVKKHQVKLTQILVAEIRFNILYHSIQKDSDKHICLLYFPESIFRRSEKKGDLENFSYAPLTCFTPPIFHVK